MDWICLYLLHNVSTLIECLKWINTDHTVQIVKAENYHSKNSSLPYPKSNLIDQYTEVYRIT